MLHSSLPSIAVLYGTYLLGQAFLRGYTTSWDEWISQTRQLPTGLLTPRNIEETAELLAKLGLAGVSDDGTVWLDPRVPLAGCVPDRGVLTRLLVLLTSKSPPLWASVSDFQQGSLVHNYIPSRDMRTLQVLGLTEDDSATSRRTMLALAYQRVDRKEIGAQGEKVCVDHEISRLVSLGRSDLAEQVVQVSLISDSFGYDIASFFASGESLVLEVKTTTQELVSVFPCFITRHEYNVAQASPSTWRLMAAHLTTDKATVLGYFSFEVVKRMIPSEPEGFCWTEAQLLLPLSEATAEP